MEREGGSGVRVVGREREREIVKERQEGGAVAVVAAVNFNIFFNNI